MKYIKNIKFFFLLITLFNLYLQQTFDFTEDEGKMKEIEEFVEKCTEHTDTNTCWNEKSKLNEYQCCKAKIVYFDTNDTKEICSMQIKPISLMKNLDLDYG